MERSFDKIKEEAGRVDLPDECEENDRAVRFLALETGVGHYDDINLLVMAVLIIFISVAFLAVNGGKINDEEELDVSMESFLSGEFTAELEERYIKALPIPEEIKAAEERVSLLYGFGNTVTEKKSGNYNSGSTNSQPDIGHNAFETDDDDDRFSENAVTTKAVQTDKDGNVVTEEGNAETAPGGGTTAVSRPPMTLSTTTTTETDEETTTTNNTMPEVTTTTTAPATTTTASTTEDTEPPTNTEPTDTEPTDTEPANTEPTDTEPTETEPAETEPPVSEETEE